MGQEYTVVVSTGGADTVFTWSGYADNISDALYHAINARDDQFTKEQRDADLLIPREAHRGTATDG